MSREQEVNPTHLFAGVFCPPHPVSMFFSKSSATLFTASFFPDGKTSLGVVEKLTNEKY